MIKKDVLATVTESKKKHANLANELTKEDIQEIMRMHNEPRRRYGLPELVWDDSLAKLAQQWADTCYWGHWASPKTRQALGADYIEKPRQTGENLSIWSDNFTTLLAGQYGTSLWTEEEPNYKCGAVIDGKECSGGQCGHWTQMMWKDTQRVGCALRTCVDGVDPRSWSQSIGDSNAKYLVCQYDPPGNFTGQVPFEQEKCDMPGKDQPKTAPSSETPKTSNVGKRETPALQPLKPLTGIKRPVAGPDNVPDSNLFRGLGRNTPGAGSDTSVDTGVFKPTGITFTRQRPSTVVKPRLPPAPIPPLQPGPYQPETGTSVGVVAAGSIVGAAALGALVGVLAVVAKV